MKKCMGCMRDYSETNGGCPVCGYSEEEGKAVAAETTEILPPETILGGRFILGRALSCSDFSIVYIAWDALLQRRTAIKEYFPLDQGIRRRGSTVIEFSSSGEQMIFEKGKAIFEKEAEILNQNQEIQELVNVYRYIRENNTSYMVMEYLEGCTLQDYLDDNKRLDTASAKGIFAMIMDAVDALHENGIGHYNLSPDNIYLEKSGRVRLLDCGMAKKELYRMVQKKIYYYREEYISPEILLGKTAEKNADLYSLGAIYYYLMTGKEPKNSVHRHKRHSKLRINDKADEKIVNLLAEVHPEMRPEGIAQLWQVCSAEDKRRFLGNGQK